MTMSKRPPAICETLLTCAAPPHMKEDLLGDLEERFHLRSRRGEENAAFWYCLEALRLLPFLVITQLQSRRVCLAAMQFGAIAFAILLIVTWEALVVRQNAWPLTASLLDAAPLSGKSLFFTIYGAIYFLGIAVIFSLSAFGACVFRRTHGWPLKRIMVIISIALTAPSVFYIIRPQPLDSISMRLFLIAGVCVAAVGVMAVVKRLHVRNV